MVVSIRVSRLTAITVTGAFLALLLLHSLWATPKYKKDTSKKCLFCHTAIPEPGDTDPRLNRDGKAFKENGNKLTEEQKKRPASVMG